MKARAAYAASHMKPEPPRPGGTTMREPAPASRAQDSETSGSQDATSPLWIALRRATRGAHELAREAGELRHHSSDIDAHLEALAEAIHQAARGEKPSLDRLPPVVPTRRLLDRLRTAFLGEVAPLRDPPAQELLLVLRAFDAVADALEEDMSHRFTSRLAGPDGLELIVEVAHDLRSPLASILFLAETLRKGQSGPLTPVQERQLGLVYSAAFGLSALASDVIELARGGDRLMDVDPVPFSVSGIMQSMYDIVLPMAEEKGLTLKLASPDSDFRIGQPSALNRVLLNLTTNALKFTAEGCVEVRGREISPTGVEFSVRDTGRGIPPQVMATLFEPFRRRLKPGDYMFSSAGLGLSICRKLVIAMGGELNVETAPDYGTRFHFTLDLPVASRL